MNRLDGTVVFHPLSKDHIINIVELMLSEVSQQLLNKGISIEFSIEDSMENYMRLEHQLIEGAAGTAVAALRKLKNNIKGQRVGVLICGSNISLDTLKNIL